MGYGYGSHWGMMGSGNGGFWPLGMTVWIIIMVAIIALISWVVRRLSSPLRYKNPRRPPGLDSLDERYARDEISREEYLQKTERYPGALTSCAGQSPKRELR